MAGVDSTVQRALLANQGLDDPSLAGELVVIVDVARWNVSTDAEDTFRAATGEFTSTSADTPASTPWQPVLEVPGFSQSILSGDWRASTGFDLSDIFLSNIDGGIDGEFDNATYSWRGREVTVRAGLRSWALSQFKVLPGGYRRVLDVLPGEDRVRITTGPLVERADKPLQENVYGGFGGAYDFAGTASVDCGDVFDLGLRGAAISFRFKTSQAGVTEVIMDKRDSLSTSPGAPGWVVFQRSSDDKLGVRIDDGSATNVSVATNAYNDGAWHTGLVVIDRDAGELDMYVDGSLEVDADDISSVTGRISSTTALTHGELASGTFTWGGELDELLGYYTTFSAEEADNIRKIAVDGVEPALAIAHKFDEYGGTDIYNEVEGPMLVQAGFSGTIDCSMGNNADPGSDSFVMTGWARWAESATGVMAGRKAATEISTGYAARVNGGDVILEASDGTKLYSVTVSGDYDDKTPWGWAMMVDRDNDLLRGWVLDYPRGTLTEGTPDDISSAGSFGGGSINFKLGEYDGGGSQFTGNLSWIFFTPVTLTEDEIKIALSEQATDLDDSAPTTPPDIIAAAAVSGAHFWPLNENSGTTATDQIGSADGTFNSIPTWVDRDGDLAPGASGAFTSSLEGGEDLKGQPKPVALGRCSRVPVVPVDHFFLLYQYSDPALGATEAVAEVYSGAYELTLTTDYTVDLTNSVIDLAASSDQPVTANVKGVKSGGAWLQFPGQLTEFVWENLAGIASGSISSTEEYDKAHPYQAGMWLTSESLDAYHSFMLAPDGFAYRTADNKMALGSRVSPTTADFTLEDWQIDRIEPVEVPPPSWFVRVGYDRTWGVHNSFLGGADTADQTAHAQEFRFVEDRQDEIREDYADAVARTYLTPYYKRKDAALLIQRMFTLDGVPRDGWRIYLGADQWSVGLSDVVAVSSYSRYSLAGSSFFTAANENGMTDGMATGVLTVWG